MVRERELVGGGGDCGGGRVVSLLESLLERSEWSVSVSLEEGDS